MSQMKFYLAASWSKRETINEYAERIGAVGHIVTSRWLDNDFTRTRSAEQNAAADVEDVYASDELLMFSDGVPQLSRGGRHIEFGLALAKAIPITIIGPWENPFHSLGQIRIVEWFDEWLDGLVQA